jgi:DNA-binding transcriptional ArsR family regulator
LFGPDSRLGLEHAELLALLPLKPSEAQLPTHQVSSFCVAGLPVHHGDGLTASELTQFTATSEPTIYRHLKRLSGMKLVVRQEGPDGSVRYRRAEFDADTVAETMDLPDTRQQLQRQHDVDRAAFYSKLVDQDDPSVRREIENGIAGYYDNETSKRLWPIPDAPAHARESGRPLRHASRTDDGLSHGQSEAIEFALSHRHCLLVLNSSDKEATGAALICKLGEHARLRGMHEVGSGRGALALSSRL